MFKKKLLAMVMALGMAGAMAACGGSSGSTSTTAAAAGNSDTATTAAAAAAADDGETYTLIFSHENAESSLVHQLTLQIQRRGRSGYQRSCNHRCISELSAGFQDG